MTAGRRSCAFLVLHLLYTVFEVDCWQEWKLNPDAIEGGPGPRRGASMVLFGERLIMFGGRQVDNEVYHKPTTYEIVEVDGVLEFDTYDEKTVQSSVTESSIFTIDGQTSADYMASVGKYQNDVWEYNVGCEVRPFQDLGCTEESWVHLNAGAVLGGCKIVRGTEVCTHPHERWYHSAAMFSDGKMLVYGGFSQLCEDFCDDLWRFEVGQLYSDGHRDESSWVQLYGVGENQKGPGKIWRHTMVTDGSIMFLFGGHRLWHGFARENSAENLWGSRAEYPTGGYLDELWVYVPDRKVSSTEAGVWTQKSKLQDCVPSPGLSWESRNDETCTVHWPRGRSSAAMDLDSDALWLFGGYTSHFPYVHTGGSGFDRGVNTGGDEQGFVPYPNLSIYLNDLWRYDLVTGKWREMVPVSPDIPAPRSDHIMVLSNQMLIMFGGYRSNYHFQDTWLYNTKLNRWLEKKHHVYPEYPANCTDDLVFIEENGCFEMTWSPYSNDSAVAPREYVKQFSSQFAINDSHAISDFERCTSVKGQPTRGMVVDGQHGRADSHVFIDQPRRQRPGWDGCRDRADGRADLENTLQWLQPAQRSGHRAVYVKTKDIMLMYGGHGFESVEVDDVTKTVPSTYFEDFWQFNINSCPSNCSLRGTCMYGYCFCDEGYYGIDCSNVSCPGDYCYYDQYTNEQICSHCCHASYQHHDGGEYEADTRKVPCSTEHPGESHGICDGFGTCQCAPPFIGEDCSTRDCMNNCNDRGWCSVEYPVSRCICDRGFSGSECEIMDCLNNCTYPNGQCNHTTGVCECSMMYSPYNRTDPYYPWMGEDCSFLVPFAAASSAILSPMVMLLVAFFYVCFTIHTLGGGDRYDGEKIR